MFDKLKQIKDLRDQAKQMKEVLAEETAYAEAMGGKVHVVINGNQQILSIEIDSELLKPELKEDLEKGIKEAVNDAIKKIHRTIAMKMQQMGGLNLPGME